MRNTKAMLSAKGLAAFAWPKCQKAGMEHEVLQSETSNLRDSAG